MMIKDIRTLALKVSNGEPVNMATVSKALSKRIFLWEKRKEITIVDGVIYGKYR